MENGTICLGNVFSKWRCQFTRRKDHSRSFLAQVWKGPVDRTGHCITEEIIEGSREEPGVPGSGHGEAQGLTRSMWESQGGRLTFCAVETTSSGCRPLRRGGREGCQKSWAPAGEIPARNSLEDIRPDPAFSSGFDLRTLSSGQVHYE